ncbi:MAG: glycosyltransferase, partial [Candidatus Zixiibacteriota bacterium]
GQLGYDLNKILNDYYLVLEPSYSGYCTPEVLEFLKYDQHKIVIQCYEEMDMAFIKRLNLNLIPIELGTNNWVDERIFEDMNREKKYDCIMVAMWSPIKRHNLLFKAVKQINDPNLKICLIGSPWAGSTTNTIRNMARFYGIENQVEIFENLPPNEVNRLFNLSKVHLLLSYKEGGNKAICEGFFANVPSIILNENIGGNRRFINEHTGRLCDKNSLAETIKYMRENYRRFNPRKWALENISATASTAILEQKLKEIAESNGELWTRPIAVKVNKPELTYYHDNVDLKPLDFEKYKL